MRPVLLLALLAACTPTSSTTTDAGTTTATTTAAATTGTTTAEPTTADTPTTAPATTTTEAATSTPATSTDATTTTDATTDNTTGEPAWCFGWQGPAGAPRFDLHDKSGNLLTAGSTLPLECGGQGNFMFGLYPTYGGFVPTGDSIDVDLVVDVDGFNDNPEGHFYSAHPVGYYIACDDVIGGVFGVVPIFPFDNLDDLSALDGKPATIHLLVPTDDEPIAVDLDVVLSVTPDASWDFCGG